MCDVRLTDYPLQILKSGRPENQSETRLRLRAMALCSIAKHPFLPCCGATGHESHGHI